MSLTKKETVEFLIRLNLHNAQQKPTISGNVYISLL